jgi:hypothetical protein
MSIRCEDKIILVVFLFLTTTLIASFTLTPYSGFASTESNNTNTLVQPDGTQGMGTRTTTTTNATSTNATIILVHGGWADGSS